MNDIPKASWESDWKKARRTTTDSPEGVFTEPATSAEIAPSVSDRSPCRHTGDETFMKNISPSFSYPTARMSMRLLRGSLVVHQVENPAAILVKRTNLPIFTAGPVGVANI